ncbi:hypothetical protein JRO89_XS03G0102400 [Xanthoceras sorbifolium]|uniref:Fe2OG dioxygenase domain-containing protein n=1 Tax=Xanthoceras sorbifolium TaxID=99658 RepID=A0ABQ8I9E1_9ROSI|nr:hypothetical protein JRO89_XS03G0102400 [Xanthoceras sorbifolium]
MVITGNSTITDRYQELKAFDDSKAGVKGLVDCGITKIPKIFIRPPEELHREPPVSVEPIRAHFTIPVVDLKDVDRRRDEAVSRVSRAAEAVGFFQVVNHGVATEVLEGMLKAARAFNELPREVKEKYYSRDAKRKVKYVSNFDLYESRSANWRDTLFCVMGPEPLDPEELPLVCRAITMEYSKQVYTLAITLFELLSEAIGLKPDHLKHMDCVKGHCLLSHYYPACPQPELTMGTSKHSDPDFLTILLQDHIGGLQIFHQNQWINVPPVPGALVVNIGDLLQASSIKGYYHIFCLW